MQLLPSGCWIGLRQLKVPATLIGTLSELSDFFPQLAETDLLEFIPATGTHWDRVSDSTNSNYCRE